MKRSLRSRFLLLTATTSAVALMGAGSFLHFLYARELADRVHAEIHTSMMELAGDLDISTDGRIVTTQSMTDPRFRQPASGLYWEVDSPKGQVLASRSLWDANLQKAAPRWESIEDPQPGEGPFGEPVLVHSRLMTLGDGPLRQQLKVTIAVNEAEVREPSRRFAQRLAVSLGILALVMLLVSVSQLAIVMSPLNRLRKSVRAIGEGTSNRVEGDYPAEMEPIVSRLNALLRQKELSVHSARARASNFAHSLKTPLTIIDTLVAELRAAGAAEVAARIAGQTGQIRRYVDRELARARMASGHGEVLRDPEAVLREILNTIAQLPRGDELHVDLVVQANQPIRMEREDFIELAGNILDNARKWAASRVRVSLEQSEGELRLSIGDDGPGIPSEALAVIAERGRRLDETIEGTGIGLAIVKDIADAYGLRLSLGRSSLGGLEVTVAFTAAPRVA